MAHEPALLGIFPYLDDLLAALRQVKKEGFKILTVFSPIHFSGIQEILGHKPSAVRYFCLAGGILGGVSLVGLAVYAHLSFRLITSGKPVLAWIPFVIFAVAAWILKGRLPRVRPNPAYDPRFSEDRFGILVGYQGQEREVILKLLKETGAEEIRDVAG
jgi:hypothetical protein